MRHRTLVQNTCRYSYYDLQQAHKYFYQSIGNQARDWHHRTPLPGGSPAHHHNRDRTQTAHSDNLLNNRNTALLPPLDTPDHSAPRCHKFPHYQGRCYHKKQLGDQRLARRPAVPRDTQYTHHPEHYYHHHTHRLHHQRFYQYFLRRQVYHRRNTCQPSDNLNHRKRLCLASTTAYQAPAANLV